jgi:hypothetical protein
MHRGKINTAEPAPATTAPAVPVSISTRKTIATRPRTKRSTVSRMGAGRANGRGVQVGSTSGEEERCRAGENAPGDATKPTVDFFTHALGGACPLLVPRLQGVKPSLEMLRDTGERGVYALASALLDEGILVSTDWQGASVSQSVGYGLTRWIDEQFDTNRQHLNLNVEITDDIKNVDISLYAYYYNEKSWREYHEHLSASPIAGIFLTVKTHDMYCYNLAPWVRTVEHYAGKTAAKNLMGIINFLSELTGGWHIARAHGRLSNWAENDDDDDPLRAGPDPEETTEGYRAMMGTWKKAIPEYAHYYKYDADVLRKAITRLERNKGKIGPPFDVQTTQKILTIAVSLIEYLDKIEELLEHTAPKKEARYTVWNEYSHVDWVTDLVPYPRHCMTWHEDDPAAYDPICGVYDDDLECLYNSEHTNIIWGQFFNLNEVSLNRIGTLRVAMQILSAQITLTLAFDGLLEILDGEKSFYSKKEDNLPINILVPESDIQIQESVSINLSARLRV